MEIVNNSIRTQVIWLVAICIAVAAAPWFSGGELPIALLLSSTAVLLGSLILWRQPSLRNFRKGPLSWYYFAYIGWAVFSLLWSVNRFSTVLWIIPLALAGIVFRLAYTLSGIPKGREAIIRLYILSVIIFSIYALWLYLTGSYERLTGSFYWANPAAAYLMPAILVSLHRTLHASWRIWGPCTVLFTTSFLLTDSRAASLVLLLVLVGYFITTKLQRKCWITLVFIFLATVIVTIGATQLRHYLQPKAVLATPGSRFSEVTTGATKSENDRVSYLNAAFKIWFSAPIIGIGAGTYADAHPAYQSSPLNASSSAHNYYAQSLAELGLVGFVLLCGVLLSLVLGILRGITAEPENRVLLLGVIALLIHFGLDIDATYPALLILLALLIGLIYTQSYRAWTGLGWWLPVMSLLVVIPAVSYYLGSTQSIRGMRAQADNDYPLAAEYYSQATNGFVYNPDWVNAEGINHYAVASSGGLATRAEADIALNLAKVAQHQDPRDGQHHQLEGRILILDKKYLLAEEAFKRALELDPYDHPEYALELAYTQLAMGDLMAANKTAGDMIAKYPAGVIANRSLDTTIRPNLAALAAIQGNYYLNKGDLRAAQAAATEALGFDQESIRARALQHQLDLRAVAQ